MRLHFRSINWKVSGICIIGFLNCTFAQISVPASSGRIEGTVCEIDGCNPIKGARVRIEIPNSGGMTRTAITDNAGGFQITQLPTGRYVLEVEADDFVPVAALPIVSIAEGGRANDVRVFMHRLGSISGRALDGNGKPLPFAQVETTSFPSVITNKATADVQGEFRISKLDSGEYTLRIAPPLDNPGMRDYLPTFYPATTNPENAERISIGLGTHVNGLEIKLSTRGFKISGRFVDSFGKPVRALARLVPRTRSTSLAAPASNAQTMNEEFEIRGVPPGSYFLYAVTDLQSERVQRFNSRVSPQWVRIPIEVERQDLDGITVPIRSTGSIRGRVRFSPDATDQTSVDFTQLTLRLQPADVMPPLVQWSPAADVSSDGDFEFAHLSELQCFFSPYAFNGEWFIAQLTLEGRDVFASGFSTAPGEDRVLDVVISNAGGRLMGFLKSAQDKPAPDSRVVLLPTQSLRANPAFRRIALSDDTGEFHIEGIAPGAYIAIAFPPEDQSAPLFLENVQWVEKYERYAERVEIAAHMESRLDLITVAP
jgi:Carboxypeptidase regulatory-like domain